MKNMWFIAVTAFVVTASFLIYERVNEGKNSRSPLSESPQTTPPPKIEQPLVNSEGMEMSSGNEEIESATSVENEGNGAPEDNETIKVVTLENWKPDIYLPPRFIQSEARLTNNPSDPNQLPEEAKSLTRLNRPEQAAIQDVHTLLSIVSGVANKGAYPTGDNIEVTNALLGKNYRKVAYLPQNHPRINEVGELTDQWGTAYSFHFESTSRVTILSAGPDREFYTDDDIIGNMR